MGMLVLLALFALLQQGDAANVKNLPEIVHEETVVGQNGVTGQYGMCCPSQSTLTSPALDQLLLYLGTQNSLEGQLEQLQNKTDSIDGQLQQLAQQEMAELQSEVDLKATVEALQATVSSQDSIIQQQAAALQQLQGTLQQQTSSLQQLETTNLQQTSSLQQLETTLQQQASTILQQANSLQQLEDKVNGARDCQELFNTGHTTSGVYTIYPDGGGRSPIHVYCDMDTDGGGWTLFQKRQDGSVNFYRDWQAYKTGFGDLRGEFWLGDDNLARLTAQDVYELRVDLEDFEGNSAYAKYSSFRVEDEIHKYRLTVEGYSGTAGDAMTMHNSQFFSTLDKDNDSTGSYHCAQTYKGGWWYNRCHDANLNGLYHGGQHQSAADGVNWQQWKGNYYSLKHTEMKIRPY
ncbi:microfibril-associated glycoprotein 4-like [Branchiostoma lanceolatum]|uniref:microfibril-associated glycoprotein 4-like n=1 Tax=Branchiostoma lanceolatum TaxID=7740 RepID=UPI0034521B6B